MRGVSEQRAPIVDISRGGLALRCGWAGETGAQVQVVLPGTDAAATARVVRVVNGVLGLAFRQETATLKLVDQALRFIGGHPSRAAA